jgi:hypothetical protein
MSLMCVLCGHETPGWDLGSAAIGRERTGASQPVHASQPVQVPLVGARRAA